MYQAKKLVNAFIILPSFGARKILSTTTEIVSLNANKRYTMLAWLSGYMVHAITAVQTSPLAATTTTKCSLK